MITNANSARILVKGSLTISLQRCSNMICFAMLNSRLKLLHDISYKRRFHSTVCFTRSHVSSFLDCKNHHHYQNIFQTRSRRNVSTSFLNMKLLSDTQRTFSHSSFRPLIYGSQSYSTHTIRHSNKNNHSDTSSVLNASDGKTVLDRFIYVKTLEGLYEDVATGIVLDTAYGDSRPDADFDPTVPVILALHDTPGTHKDVVPLIDFFAKVGCRVICPTYPGHGDTRGIMKNFDDVFSQATMERATFVHDFVDDLGIKRVDVVVGFGASAYAAMALCTRLKEVYRSMALISPWPFSRTRFQIENKMLDHVYELWELMYFRPLARLLLHNFKVGNAVTVDEKLSTCYLLKNVDLGEAEGLALTASIKSIPRLVAYGAKDELVPEELYRDVVDKLDISSRHAIEDRQESTQKGWENDGRALVFPNTGYDILSPHRSVLCANILQLVQQFHPHIKI